MELGTKLMGVVISIGAGALSGLASFGIYGALRDRGYGAWKAGTATGAINAAIGVLAVLALSSMAPESVAPAEQMSGFTVQRLRGLTVTQLPKAMGLVAARRIGGVYTEVI